MGRGVLLLLLLTSPAGAAFADPAAAQADEPGGGRRPPNIIFIMADDLGWGDLGCYGNTSVRTPRLDAMARQGVRFTNYYAGSTVCTPSRAVLMTGLHTGHTRLRGNGPHSMLPGEVTVAEVLKAAGYATGVVGKWGLGFEGTAGVPTRQGFDAFYGYMENVHAHNYYPPFLIRDERREPLPNVVPGRDDGAGVAAEKRRYSNDLFVDEALAFVERQAKAGRPFFLYLPFTIPHANNEAGAAGMEVPDLGAYADAPGWPAPRRAHAAMVTRLDGYVGRLLDRLAELGIDGDTAVFFTSDNGPHAEGGYRPEMNDSNGPLRGHKRDLYEGGVRVPMIARWPGRVPAGRTSDHVAWHADVLPTLAALAGVPPADLPPTDGISLAPVLTGDEAGQARHEFLYWEFYEQGGKQAVRSGNWKAVRLPMLTGRTELYDLGADAAETTDVAGAHPDVVKNLEGMMGRAHTPSELWKARE
jgi:arylsulfatase A-like enzyme